MKNVLIVSPHFPPINAPDMQRVRLVLPHLRAHGWEPTVLAVAPKSVEGGVVETRLLDTFPADIRVVRVHGLPPTATRWLGVGSLWWRCRRALMGAGDYLLENERFDLVFISTTQFGAFSLGPRWRARFGVPYMVDYQDPWISDYYERSGARPPGGRLKFAVSQWSARRHEPRVVRDASGLIVVSEGYTQALSARYPWFDAKRATLLPFGAAPEDFAAARDYRPAQPLIDFQDGNFHHVYVGRGGSDMSRALVILFRAFKRYRDSHPDRAARMRFHFIGTDYAPPPHGRDWVLPVATVEGVAPQVTEHRARIPYFDALYYLRNAGALLAIGSDDPAYSASKIFPCVLARRPMLLISPRESPALKFAEQVAAGVCCGFSAEDDNAALATDVHQRWFVADAAAQPVVFDEAGFAPFLASVLTGRLAKVFDGCLPATRRKC